MPLRARLADSMVLCFAGWCLGALYSEKMVHSSSRLVHVFILALVSFAGIFLGLFLKDIISVLGRIGISPRYLTLAARVIATGVIGVYIIENFIEGCADGLAVICFGVFLLILLRMLNVSPRQAAGVSADVHANGHSATRPSAPEALLAPGASGKLREFFAMVASGVSTGLLGGMLRAATGAENLGERPAAFCLLPVSVLVLGVIIRLSSVRLIQGKDKLKGRWRTGLVVVDGLIVSTLLAIAVSAKLPPAISPEGDVSKNQLLWIPLGLILGFTWGVVFGSLEILLLRAIKHFVAPEDSSGHSASPSRHVLGEAVEVVGEGEHEGEHDSERTQATPPARSSRLGFSCSCLLATFALAAAMVFAFMASMGIWKLERIDEDIKKLPKGCPKACQDAELDRFRLGGVDFSGADLSRAKLREADLEGAKLRGAILRDAFMLRVDLRNADLSGADFTGADMRRSILLDARFSNTRLRGAYLRNATLQDLDLSTADLEGADLHDAVYSKKTKWPAGFDVERAGLRLAD